MSATAHDSSSASVPSTRTEADAFLCLRRRDGARVLIEHRPQQVLQLWGSE